MSSRSTLGVMSLVICGLFYQCSSTLKVPVAADAQKSGVTLDVLIKGRNTYIQNCSSCHSLYLPETYSPAQWKKELDRMQKPAKIDDQQKELILKYLINTGQK